MKINKFLAGLLLGALLLVPIYTSASDLESSNYSETAASNTAAVPNGFPDGIAPSSVKSIVREIMGAVKRQFNRSGPTITSGGSANAQTLTYTTAPAAYVQGQTYSFIAGFSNSAATTLNVGGLGAKNVTKRGTTALSGGEIAAGEVVVVQYDGTEFQIVSSGAGTAGTNSIANSQLAQMATNTIKGNNSGSTANAADLTVAQTVTMLGVVKTITRQTFTSSGTYTPHAGILYARVQVQAPGGGSGGCGATSGAQVSGSGGGGGGGYAEGIFTAAQIGASQPVTIGAVGTAATAGVNTGGTGGTTSLGALISATGGTGGSGGTGASVPSYQGGGGAGGTGTGGDFQRQGSDGGASIGITGAGVRSGDGGSSMLGGAPGGSAGGFAAQAGYSYGGGAMGGGNGASAAARAGAAGGAGVVIITEYNSQ